MVVSTQVVTTAVAAAAAFTSAVFPDPNVAPTITLDYSDCYTTNFTQLFDVPRPTGAVSSALSSYGVELRKTCTSTGTARLNCPVPDSSLWCGISTAVPTPVASEVASYGSAASSWWAAQSSAVVDAAQNCPFNWWDASTDHPGNQWALNRTMIFAECYGKPAPVNGGPISASSATASSAAKTSSGGTAAVSEPTKTTLANNGGPMGVRRPWMLASAGLAAMAMNEMG